MIELTPCHKSKIAFGVFVPRDQLGPRHMSDATGELPSLVNNKHFCVNATGDVSCYWTGLFISSDSVETDSVLAMSSLAPVYLDAWDELLDALKACKFQIDPPKWHLLLVCGD